MSGPIYLPVLHSFEKNNVFTGSCGLFRYKEKGRKNGRGDWGAGSVGGLVPDEFQRGGVGLSGSGWLVWLLDLPGALTAGRLSPSVELLCKEKKGGFFVRNRPKRTKTDEKRTTQKIIKHKQRKKL